MPVLSTRLGALLLALFALLAAAPAQTAEGPRSSSRQIVDPGFENGPVTGDKDGWRLYSGEGSAAIRDSETLHSGAASLRLENRPGARSRYAILAQKIDPAEYRGKRVRFSAWVRTRGAPTQAGLWFRVDRPAGRRGFIDTMADRPYSGLEWRRLEIIAPVDADTDAITFGLILELDGVAWIDDARIEILGDASGPGAQPARALDTRGQANLEAFSKLYGYVRWFHPSDQAAKADWNQIALAGVDTVESASTPDDLALSLQRVFGPVAPTLQIYREGHAPPLPAALAPRTGPVIAWRHEGVQLRDLARQSPYHSRRIVTGEPQKAGGGELFIVAEAESLGGRTVIARVWTRANDGAVARFVISALGKDNVWKPLADEEAKGGGWRQQTLRVAAPADTRAIKFAVISSGEGSVDVDDVTAVDSDGHPIALPNGDFEFLDGSDVPANWDLRGGGCAVSLIRGLKSAHAARLRFTRITAADLPRPERPLEINLGRGLVARLPSALYLEEGHTLPAGDGAPQARLDRPEGYTPSGDDRTTRLAGIVVTWNAIEHFWPYFDGAKPDWPAALPQGLQEAATAPDGTAYGDVLRRMLQPLADGHAFVDPGGSRVWGALPLELDWIENRLVITEVHDPALPVKAGDIITAVKGQSAEARLVELDGLQAASSAAARRNRSLEEFNFFSLGEVVPLTIRRPDGSSGDVAVRAEEPDLYSGERRPDKIAQLKPGVMYVDINRINDADFEGALAKLAQAKAVIFDLRGYPHGLALLSHLADHPISSAYWKVAVTTRPDHTVDRWKVSRWFIAPKGPRLQGRIVFITDERAVSFSESIMGVVEAEHLGEIVGHTTAGTNGNINTVFLPGGYAVSFTGMNVIKHDRSRHMGVGIKPTVPVERTIAGVAAGRDELLEKAIEVATRP